jgi:hypothetical protein
MCPHDGSRRISANFADLVIKLDRKLKTNLVLIRFYQVFIIRSAKLAQYEGAPSCGHIRANYISTIRPILLRQYVHARAWPRGCSLIADAVHLKTKQKLRIVTFLNTDRAFEPRPGFEPDRRDRYCIDLVCVAGLQQTTGNFRTGDFRAPPDGEIGSGDGWVWPAI